MCSLGIFGVITSLVWAASLQDSLGKPVPECQTIMDFTATTDVEMTVVTDKQK